MLILCCSEFRPLFEIILISTKTLHSGRQASRLLSPVASSTGAQFVFLSERPTGSRRKSSLSKPPPALGFSQ